MIAKHHLRRFSTLMRQRRLGNMFRLCVLIVNSVLVSIIRKYTSVFTLNYIVADHDIGVITPYHAQCLKIRGALKGRADSVKVGSVEEFQGQVRHRMNKMPSSFLMTLAPP
jgi:hypothetical protein